MVAKVPVTEPSESPGPTLLRGLVHATYWVDDGLQAYLRAHTGLSLPRAQSMLMVYLTEGVNRQLELAKRLRVSKQAVRQVIKELQAKGIVELERDPANGRYKLVQLTDYGRELGLIARQGLQQLESLLLERLGDESLQALRAGLSASWGDVPQWPDRPDR